MNWIGILNHKIQGEIPSWFPGNSILICTIKKTISIAINPQRAKFLVCGKSNPIPKPSSSKSKLTPSYEFIFHLVKSMEYDYYPTPNKLSHKTKPSENN